MVSTRHVQTHSTLTFVETRDNAETLTSSPMAPNTTQFGGDDRLITQLNGPVRPLNLLQSTSPPSDPHLTWADKLAQTIRDGTDPKLCSEPVPDTSHQIRGPVPSVASELPLAISNTAANVTVAAETCHTPSFNFPSDPTAHARLINALSLSCRSLRYAILGLWRSVLYLAAFLSSLTSHVFRLGLLLGIFSGLALMLFDLTSFHSYICRVNSSSLVADIARVTVRHSWLAVYPNFCDCDKPMSLLTGGLVVPHTIDQHFAANVLRPLANAPASISLLPEVLRFVKADYVYTVRRTMLLGYDSNTATLKERENAVGLIDTMSGLAEHLELLAKASRTLLTCFLTTIRTVVYRLHAHRHRLQQIVTQVRTKTVLAVLSVSLSRLGLSMPFHTDAAIAVEIAAMLKMTFDSTISIEAQATVLARRLDGLRESMNRFSEAFSLFHADAVAACDTMIKAEGSGLRARLDLNSIPPWPRVSDRCTRLMAIRDHALVIAQTLESQRVALGLVITTLGRVRTYVGSMRNDVARVSDCLNPALCNHTGMGGDMSSFDTAVDPDNGTMAGGIDGGEHAGLDRDQSKEQDLSTAVEFLLMGVGDFMVEWEDTNAEIESIRSSFRARRATELNVFEKTYHERVLSVKVDVP